MEGSEEAKESPESEEEGVEEAQPGSGESPAPQKASPWPSVDPEAIQNKQFMTAQDVAGGQVAVTARDGEVQRRGAPSHLFAQLVDAVGNTIKQVGNLTIPPLVVRAEAGASITVYFGETLDVDARQAEIPYYGVWRSAQTVARLMSLDEDTIFDFALDVGVGATAYANLARFVESEGISIDWEARGLPAQSLDAERAARQYVELAKPPEYSQRSMIIDGLLYGVIYEGPGRGRARMRLSNGSATPPRHHGRTVILEYETEEIEQAIIHNLIGEPVVATIRVEDPVPRTSVLPPEPSHAVIEAVERGGTYDMRELFRFDEEDR